MKKIVLVIFLLIPTFAYSTDSQKISYEEYMKKVNTLASECTTKGMPSFNGFCISQKYGGQVKYGDPTQTSITVGLELANFEHFYKTCDHSRFDSEDNVFNDALNLIEAKKFYEEIKVQKEALETYSNHFSYCTNKDKNDAYVTKKLQWFTYMVNKYTNHAPKRNDAQPRP